MIVSDVHTYLYKFDVCEKIKENIYVDVNVHVQQFGKQGWRRGGGPRLAPRVFGFPPSTKIF